MVRMQESVVTGGVAIQLELADQACLYERMERVVDRGAGSAGVPFVERGPEFFRGSVIGMAQEVVEHGYPLWRAPKARGGESLVDIPGC